jgi:plasmid stabilization system protein ParE
MITYDFHPEVRRDLDEIWDFIAADNPAAADRLITEIFDAIRRSCPVSRRRPPRPGPHLTASAFHFGT